jgi:hypothetical protein
MNSWSQMGRFKLAFAKTDKKQKIIDLRGISTNECCGSGSGMAEKSSLGTRQTDSKNLGWFGEIERKLAKLSMPT